MGLYCTSSPQIIVPTMLLLLTLISSILALPNDESDKSSGNSTEEPLPAWINPWSKLPRSRQFSITCCDNSWPKPDVAVVPHMIEFQVEDLGPASYDPNCHRFNGQLLLPSNIIQQFEKNLEISCNCTKPHSDRNCRNLPPCENAGYRSFSIQLRCVCPPKWFGPVCEFYCLYGDLVKNENQIDKCVCEKNYEGSNCDQILCYNGGTPAYGNRACACQLGFYGRFCEVYLNQSRFGPDMNRRDNFSRDISSSAVSLLLVVIVGFVIYFLVRRRTNRLRLQMRQLAAARHNPVADSHDFSSPQINGVDHPPSYSVATSVVSSEMSSFHAEMLPPPPSYDDIVKENLAAPKITTTTGINTDSTQTQPPPHQTPDQPI